MSNHTTHTFDEAQVGEHRPRASCRRTCCEVHVRVRSLITRRHQRLHLLHKVIALVVRGELEEERARARARAAPTLASTPWAKRQFQKLILEEPCAINTVSRPHTCHILYRLG